MRVEILLRDGQDYKDPVLPLPLIETHFVWKGLRDYRIEKIDSPRPHPLRWFGRHPASPPHTIHGGVNPKKHCQTIRYKLGQNQLTGRSMGQKMGILAKIYQTCRRTAPI